MACAAKKASKRAQTWNGKRPQNGSRGKCKTGCKFISSCPECGRQSSVQPGQSTAFCGEHYYTLLPRIYKGRQLGGK